MINLANTDPPDRVVATLESMGLTINDVNPAAVGLEGALRNLSAAGLDLTDAAAPIFIHNSGPAITKLDSGNGSKQAPQGILDPATTAVRARFGL